MRRARLLAVALLLTGLPTAVLAASAPAPAQPDSLARAAAGVELLYFHATLRCETCLGLEAAIDRCLRAEFADELAEGWLTWRSLNYELAEGRALHAALGLRGSELVIRTRAGASGASEPIRSVWSTPEGVAVCDSLRPILAKYLRAHADADASRGR